MGISYSVGCPACSAVERGSFVSSETGMTLLLLVVIGYGVVVSGLAARQLIIIRRMRQEARRLETDMGNLRAQVEVYQAQAERWQRLEARIPANLAHDFRTPIRLISGFCDALLAPRHALPAAFRGDVEAIQRSAQRLQPLIEQVLSLFETEVVAAGRPPTAAPPVPRRAPIETGIPATIVVLTDNAAVSRLFEQHIDRHTVIAVNSVEAIGNLAPPDTRAVVITSETFRQRIPEIAHLVGARVPLVTCSLGSTGQSAQHGLFTDFLMKPVTPEAMSAALERLGIPVREVVIIEDNRDQMELLARQFASLSPPVKVWKAYSGREGLALLNEQAVDVALLDIVLPDMDGLTLAHFLRTEPTTAALPLLLVSGHQATAVVSPPLPGKIAVYRLDGYEEVELIRQVEALVTQFSQAAAPPTEA